MQSSDTVISPAPAPAPPGTATRSIFNFAERAQARPPTSVAPAELNRIVSFDALRGIMCVGIALFHFVPYFFEEGEWQYAASRYLAYFTDIFFVMGGFFLGWRISRPDAPREPTREFVAQRLSRLYPLHLATLCFYLLLGVAVWRGLLQPENPLRYDPGSILPHLTLTHGLGFGEAMAFNYPSWAVSGVLVCDLLAAAILAARQHRYWLLAIALAASLTVASVAAAWLGESITSLQDSGWGALRALPSFLFGIILAMSGLRIRSRALAAGVLIAGLLLAFTPAAPLTGPARLATVYLLVAGVLASDTAQLWTPLYLRPLQALGRYSYGVYLLHSLVITLLISLVFKRILVVDALELGATRPLLAYLALAACIGMSFLAAHISLLTVERFGGEWLRRMLLPRRRTAETARPVAQ